MSANWSQGGQPPGPPQNYNNNYYPQGPPNHGPLRTCYNCGSPTHFISACPEPNRSANGGMAIHGMNHTPFNGNGIAASTGHWANNQNLGSVVTHFPAPKNTPAVTHYTAPGPQFDNAPAPYTGPSQPYQQYPAQGTPTPQSYAPYSQIQYSAPQYGNNQPPNQPPYNAPTQQQYGYQGPPNNAQYPPVNVPAQQYNTLGYHKPPRQFVNLPYQPPPNQYQPQANGYGEMYNQNESPVPYQGALTQWNNNIPPASASYNTPSHQQQNQQPRIISGHQREILTTPGLQSTTPQPNGNFTEGQQQIPPTPDSNQGSNQQPAVLTAHGSPSNTPFIPGEASDSRPSSVASTPYARRGSDASMGRAPSVFSTAVQEKQRTVSQTGIRENKQSEEDKEFNWDFKKAFVDNIAHEVVAIAQPLSMSFDMTPVPLLDKNSKNSVSRYARKDNLKEFTRPIQTSPQWSYLQQDPAFAKINLDSELIPLDSINAWMHARHGTTAEEQRNRRTSAKSRKRGWSEEHEDQADVDNQLQQGVSDSQISSKRQKNEASPRVIVVESPASSICGTPTLARSGTPSFGAEEGVWAPEPGEGVVLDPTEALLQSLGVTGSPKPVRPQKPRYLPLGLSDIYNIPAEPYRPILDEIYQSPQGNHNPQPAYKQGNYMPQQQNYVPQQENTDWQHQKFNLQQQNSSSINSPLPGQDSGRASAPVSSNAEPAEPLDFYARLAAQMHPKRPAQPHVSTQPHQPAIQPSNGVDIPQSTPPDSTQKKEPTPESDSSLSPTSALVLGKMNVAPRKVVRTISGKNRKAERPQPVVAEAYRYARVFKIFLF
ncbi:hypothetical protein B7494_g4124 [Chlorociboria aeruginascens]|nr:hypothetical protein B7494_g4124 [Chlorociboria aeruginascens]